MLKSVCYLLLFITNYMQAFDYVNDELTAMHDNEPVKEIAFPVKIKAKSGKVISLKCKHACHKSNITRWEFAHCKYCNHNQLPWKVIQKNRKKPCESQLQLKNVTHFDNGLYRCVLNEFTVTSEYEIEVSDVFALPEEPPPKILAIEANYLPFELFTDVVIRCKVSSKQFPLIWWIKQVDNGPKYDFKYLDKLYIRLNKSQHDYSMHDDDIYISKLKLSNLTHLDSGIYVCVAITEQAKDFRDVLLKISSGFRPSDDSNALLLLFLIPLPFIFIPIGVWLCYFKKKSVKRKKAMRNQQQKCILLQTTI